MNMSRSLSSLFLLLCCTASLTVEAGAPAAADMDQGATPLEVSPAPAVLPGDAGLVWSALASRFVDYGLVAGSSAGIQFLTSATFGIPSPTWFEHDTWRLSAWAALTMSIPLWTTFTLMDAAPSGGTLGKRLLGVRVVNDDGSGLELPKSLLRTALTFVGWELAHLAMFVPRNFVLDTPAAWQSIGLSIATAWLVADIVFTIATGGRKGLADWIVGTHLVRTSVPTSGGPIVAARW